MTGSQERIGLLAGTSDLPLEVAKAIEDSGKQLFIAAFEGAADPSIETPGRDVRWFRVGHLEALLEGLRRSGSTSIVLAGKLPHDSLFFNDDFDSRLLALLHSLPDRRGSTILAGFVDLLTAEGLPVRELPHIVPGLVAVEGHIAGPPPTPEQMRDARFGWKIAKRIAEMDVGQTIIIKDLAVVAVEAMEGTDGAIERAGRITGGGNVVVKVSSPDHDFRFDVPTVGPHTASSLARAGGGVIAVESGRCFLLGLRELNALCRDRSISLVSLSDEDVPDKGVSDHS